MTNSETERTRVVAMKVSIGGAASVVIAPSDDPNENYELESSNLLIQNLLLQAMLTRVISIDLEVYGETNVIKRILPFEGSRDNNAAFPVAQFMVTRIATQRMPDGRNEHLEVFLQKREDGTDKAYNVYDPFLIQLLIAANGFRVDVEFDGVDDLAQVSLGQFPKDVNK